MAATVPKLSEMDKVQDQVIALYHERDCTATAVSKVRRVFRILKLARVTRISDLDDRAVRRFASALKTDMPDVSPRTHNHFLQSLRAICGHLVSLGIIRKVPTFPFLPQSHTFAKVRQATRLSANDVKRLLDVLHSEAGTWTGLRLYTLVAIILYGGLGRTAAITLRVEDVDLEGGSIRVLRTRQTARGQLKTHVRIAKELDAILRVWMRQIDGELLFPGKKRKGRSGPWGEQTRGRYSPLGHLQLAGASVGLPKVTFDMLHRFFDEKSEPNLGELREAAKVPESRPAVVIAGPHKPVLVWNKPKGVLTPAQYEIIKILVDAGPKGLSSSEIAKVSSHGGWLRTLENLRDRDPDWGSAIVFPGKPFGCYRIAWT